MNNARLFSLLAACSLVSVVFATEPKIARLTESATWQAAFPASEIVTLNGRSDTEKLPGVKLHDSTNTIYKLDAPKPVTSQQISTPLSLWEAIRVWVAISHKKPMTDELWKSITPAEYHDKVGKPLNPPDAEGMSYLGEWPDAPELDLPIDGGTNIYVAGVLEHGGYLMPLCIVGPHLAAGIPTNYIFDHLDINDNPHMTLKPKIKEESGKFLFSHYGGINSLLVPMAADDGVLAVVHGDGSVLVDIWFEENLDRLLPKLSHPDHTETQSGEMISKANGK